MNGTVGSLLKELSKLQSQGDSIYPKGIYPSKRYHPFLPYEREDDNLFFTVSVIHILQGCYEKFTEPEKKVVESIAAEARKSYSLFKNKDGIDTYNFWQTKPSRQFPNGRLMHRFNHFKIPDDVDDTALVYLIENADRNRVDWLRKKLNQHANLARKRAFNPLPKYRNLKCYSTFFGEKMYIDFDVCVLSNLMRAILSRVEEHELNEYDKGTLEFICSVIENNEHITLPFYSASNYPTTELILYHLSRLIPVMPNSYRKRIESIITKNVKSFLSNATGMNLVLLENAAMKLRLPLESQSVDIASLLNDTEFFFFHAGMITAFENRLAQRFADNSFFHLRYTSKALNGALLIENLILKRRLTP